jgi:hypothetical protein
MEGVMAYIRSACAYTSGRSSTVPSVGSDYIRPPEMSNGSIGLFYAARSCSNATQNRKLEIGINSAYDGTVTPPIQTAETC